MLPPTLDFARGVRLDWELRNAAEELPGRFPLPESQAAAVAIVITADVKKRPVLAAKNARPLMQPRYDRRIWVFPHPVTQGSDAACMLGWPTVPWERHFPPHLRQALRCSTGKPEGGCRPAEQRQIAAGGAVGWVGGWRAHAASCPWDRCPPTTNPVQRRCGTSYMRVRQKHRMVP